MIGIYLVRSIGIITVTTEKCNNGRIENVQDRQDLDIEQGPEL